MSLGVMIAAVFALVGAAAPADAATVAVSAEGLTPAQITIPPSFSVTWTNTTAEPHAVAPTGTPAFAGFTLAPGERRTVPFRRPGRYRYRLDGTIAGVVDVRAAVAAPPDRRGRGSAKCETRRTYRYTITVQGRKTATDPGGVGGSFDTAFSWAARWRNAPITIESTCAGRVDFRMAARGAVPQTAPVVGTVTAARYSASDTRLSPSGQPDPCIVAFVAPTLAIEATLAGGGFRSFGGWSLVVSSSLPRHQFSALEAVADAVHAAACPDDADLRPTLDAFGQLPEATTRGIVFGPPTHGLGSWFAVRQSRRPVAPIDKLLAGKSFSVSSGRKRFGPGAGDETAQWSVTYRFTRVR